MKVRKLESPQEEAQGITRWVFFCPGCKCGHQFRTGAGQWTFNGDQERPTIHPSVLTWRPEPNGVRTEVCHSFVTDGMIRFLGDCDHALKGRTVPLEDF